MAMKFNIQLKEELKRYEKIVANQSSAPTAATRETDEKPESPKLSERTSEKVVAGDILWKPIDRAAAMLLAKAPWWAQPVATPKPEREKKESKPKKARKHMKGTLKAFTEPRITDSAVNYIPNSSYTSDVGLKVVVVNGQQMIDLDSARALICMEIANLPRETRPAVKAAEDARQVIAELTEGIGGQMEKFRSDVKLYLEDIRQTRFAVVTETSHMTTHLKEVRQFFLGSDYKEQVGRLREFVELCERLQKLKESGFLDCVADTMLRLAEREAV